ncbi:1955_t:CDS:2, partial [Gigaspora margarita]
KAFEELKKKLMITSILAYPDFTRPFILFTDASNLVLEAIRSQADNNNKEGRSLCKLFTYPAEKNYLIETYQIGDKVMLHKTLLSTLYSSKLEQSFTEPYYIHEVCGSGLYKLRTIKTVPNNKPLKTMESYLTDLWQTKISSHYSEPTSEGTWFKKLKSICTVINTDNHDQVDLLQYYYFLGECLEKTNENPELYQAREFYNLLGNKFIIANIMYRIAEKDFQLLLREAQKFCTEELSEFLN